MSSDGEAAFPVQELNGDGRPATLNVGLTARDYFAGQALIGLLASSRWEPTTEKEKTKFAAMAFNVADAMLRARGLSDV